MVALQILVLSVWVRVLVRQLLKKSPVGDFFVANLRVLVLISFPIFESKPFWRAKVLLFSDICKKKCSFSQKLHFFSLVCYAHLLSVGRLVLLRNVYLHAAGIKRALAQYTAVRQDIHYSLIIIHCILCRQARYSLFIIHYSLHSLPKAKGSSPIYNLKSKIRRSRKMRLQPPNHSAKRLNQRNPSSHQTLPRPSRDHRVRDNSVFLTFFHHFSCEIQKKIVLLRRI